MKSPLGGRIPEESPDKAEPSLRKVFPIKPVALKIKLINPEAKAFIMNKGNFVVKLPLRGVSELVRVT